ncbi:CHAT domain-containing protein [Corallococcus aberystwythensis]|uniref:CHAT domain-containing protein n=1 Tax=Corallococcus aberystwythensis TaxID=2316722 RepID=A0A3A8R6T9_9BACT|nr:CHAT domain-containing protein [Corallococcus aberystwythensis]
MEKAVEVLIRNHLAEARLRRSSILWTPGSNRVEAVRAALAKWIRGARYISAVQEEIHQAVDLLFAEVEPVTEEELLEAFGTLRDTLDSDPRYLFKSSSQVDLLFLAAVLAQTGESGLLPEEALVALLLEAQALETRFARLGERIYRIRPQVLAELGAAFGQVSDHLRHMDLVVRLEQARCVALLVAQPSTGFALTQLQALVRDIQARLQETHDGEEAGPCPDGQPVRPARKARRIFQAGDLRSLEPFCSLPRLLTAARLALGRALVESPLDTPAHNFEQAFDAFNQAHEALAALGETERAVHSAVCALECLARLAQSDSDAEHPFQYQMRAYDLGRARREWVRSQPLPDPVSLRFLSLLEAAHIQASCWGSLLRLESLERPDPPVEERLLSRQRIIEEVLQGIRAHAFLVGSNASDHPWEALSHACAVSVQFTDFVEEVLREDPAAAASREETRRIKDRRRDLLRGLLGADFIEKLLEALSTASRSLWRQLEVSEDASPCPLPNALASPVRLYEAVVALMRILNVAQLPLTGPQLEQLQSSLGNLALPALPVKTLLDLADNEFAMLGWTLKAGTPLEDVLAHVEKRLGVLDTQLAWPALSASERTLLSDWMARLVLSLRLSTNDLAAVAPTRALALLDLTGASAFRTASLLHGMGERLQWMDFTANTVDSISEAILRNDSTGMMEDTPNIFANLYSARDDLDGWGRLKMIHEASRERWAVRTMFDEMLNEGISRVTVLPPDASASEKEYMALVTGVPPERWERREDGVYLVHQVPQGPEEIGEYVGRARHRLLECHGYLASRGLVSDGRAAPRATPEGLEAFLAAHPEVAILVPGFFPEVATPMSVFFHQGGHAQRQFIGSLDDIPERAPGGAALLEFQPALGKDLTERSQQSWQELEQVFARLCSGYESWARRLAEVLDCQGITGLLILHRGHQQVFLPWEDLRISPGGPRLGERFRMGHLHTLAPLPRHHRTDTPAREGVVQLHGEGLSHEQMEVARAIQLTLADHCCGRPPLSGKEAREARRLYHELKTARRVRLFLHGHHDRLNPDVDRLTLVDAEHRDDWVNLRSRDLRRLPLAGVECVELWACQGSSHGRELSEHGPGEEPEDVSAALLLAGASRVVASRWHVPALPSALLMERFALFVDDGLGEAQALEHARRECQTLFQRGGQLERAVVDRVVVSLRELAGRSAEVRDLELRGLLEEAVERALRELRARWYLGREGPGPRALPHLEGARERLVSFSAPRPERLAVSLREDPEAQAEALVADHLRFFRSPMCWAGWRLILRTLEDWRG